MIKGKAIDYKADNIDTDVIIPARYLNTSDPNELAKHCMEAYFPFKTGDADKIQHRVYKGELVDRIKKEGLDIIVAQENFGCGSSREHAPIAIKAAGVKAVIAKSFARIFYRNAINIGLPILECKEAVDGIDEGDEVEIDLSKGEIKNSKSGKSFQAVPFPEFMQELIKAGGLINYVKKKISS